MSNKRFYYAVEAGKYGRPEQPRSRSGESHPCPSRCVSFVSAPSKENAVAQIDLMYKNRKWDFLHPKQLEQLQKFYNAVRGQFSVRK